MKALLLYSDKTGFVKSDKYYDKIVKTLAIKYEVASKLCNSIEELRQCAISAYESFDVLLVAGGDGTLNAVINAIAPLKESQRPIIGYIPCGTMNDAGKSYGINSSIRKALKIILKGNVVESDIGKCNDKYFLYLLAVGKYSDISYKVGRKYKKRIGKLAYYNLAFKEAFRKSEIDVEINANGVEIKKRIPFLLILNGNYAGGFKVNKKGSINDGLLDVFISDLGPFNGLTNYAFHKKKVAQYQCSKLDVELKQEACWCSDGEPLIAKHVEVSCLPKHIKMLVK